MFRLKRKSDKLFLSELKAYIDSHIQMPRQKKADICEECFRVEEDTVCSAPMGAAMPMARNISPKASQSIDLDSLTAIKKQPSFADNLFRIIDEKGLKDSKVYKKADIDRRLFSKIRSDNSYHPSKETAIKLCLALQLDIAQTERLLETAGYCLSLSNTGDLVIRYCIENNEFNIININEALDYFSQPIL